METIRSLSARVEILERKTAHMYASDPNVQPPGDLDGVGSVLLGFAAVCLIGMGITWIYERFIGGSAKDQ